MSEYSLSDLSDLADVTPRTIRYYIAQGLLRSPEGSGPGARYDDGHLHRLRMIRQLQREHLPLAEIRKRLAAISDDDVATLLTKESPVRESAADYVAALLHDRGIARPSGRTMSPPRALATEPAAYAAPRLRAAMPPLAMPPMPTRVQADPRASDRSQWDRIVLAEDIELHVRRPLTRDQNRTVDRIVAIAQQLLKEDPQ